MRWAVVTGASSGIGLEFARQLAKKRFSLVLVSNQEKELNECAEHLRSLYFVEALTLFADLSIPESVAAITGFLTEKGIVPEVLVNNAGIFDFRQVADLSENRIDIYIGLHVRAVTMLSVEIGRMMAGRRHGYILNMSSMSCWMPMPGIALYSSTKAYIRAFSRAFRVEMKDSGVSVTVACPGGIATNLFGLSEKLQRFAVKIGVLVTPERFVRRALKKMFRRKAQYINGGLNRLSIVAVASLPEWARLKVKRVAFDNKRK
ncbi:MAG: SDR family NAD(P)-dependent oxidoreductase [Bacteroides sp.]|nr:SDR family NAD(P)-dependent oxidoreductase [Bacteroides sp.]